MDYMTRKNTWLAKRDIELKNCKDEVLNQLESKYGEDFEVIGSIGQCLGLPSDRWGVRPRGGGETFLALGYLTLDGYEVSDSYVKPAVKDNFGEKLKKAIHSMDGEVKADIEVYTECSRDICRLNSRITLIVREKDAKDTVMSLCKRISANELTASISWYAVKESSFYGITDISVLKKAAVDSGSAFVDKRRRISVYDDKECGYYDKHAAPLTSEQLERLCAIAYLDGVIENSQMEYLGKILRCMKVFGFEGGCEMTPGEWDYVIDNILSDTVLSRLRLVKSIDVTERNQFQYGDIMPGHRALCFVDPSNAAYVIFRGTSGDYEWYDNAEGMVLAETTQQRAALRFVTEVAEMAVTELIVAGHSKGGNKAQYAAIASPAGMVSRCLSLDGQGFSEYFIIKNRESIISRMGNIKLMAERRDFVNCLGLRLYNADFHVGRRGEPDSDHIFGQPLPYFHCPDSCRDKSGELGPQTCEGGVSKVINGFTTYFLTNPKYKDSRYDISVDLILLMMTNKKYIPGRDYQGEAAVKIAEAIKELTIVFCEMVAEQGNFRDDIVGLFLSETDLILATIGMLKGDEVDVADAADAEEGSIWILYIQALKREFIENSAFRKDFITTLRYLSKLVRKMVRENNPNADILVKYIKRSINELIKEFTVKAVGKIAGEIFTVLREILY